MTYTKKRKHKHRKHRRKQIGRGKKMIKALAKNVGLPLLHKKFGSRKFQVPGGFLPFKFRVKKQGNSYGLDAGLDLFGGFRKKQIL